MAFKEFTYTANKRCQQKDLPYIGINWKSGPNSLNIFNKVNKKASL